MIKNHKGRAVSAMLCGLFCPIAIAFAQPGTTVIVSAAIARDAPIEQRMNARKTRRMKKADRHEDVVFIGFGSSVGTTTIAKSIMIRAPL